MRRNTPSTPDHEVAVAVAFAGVGAGIALEAMWSGRGFELDTYQLSV